MKRIVISLIGTTALLLTFLTTSASAEEGARIHLLHGIPDVPVDVAVDGENVFAGFEFGDTQDLSAFAGATLTNVQVLVAGTEDVAIDAGDITLPASGNYTVIAHLTADGTPTLGVFENDTSATAAGEGRLIVRHTAAAPAVDILANGTPAFSGVENPNEGSVDLAAGTISASVVPAGATEPVVIGPADLAIEDGTALIVYAVGSLEGGSLTVLTESITGIGTAPTAVNTGNSPVTDASGSSLALVGLLGLAALVTVAGARRMATVTNR